MAAQTENTYISGTVIDNVKIPMADLWFVTIMSSEYGIVGLTPHSTHYKSFWRQFYGSHDPTNSVIATTSRSNPTRLTSLKDKENEFTESQFWQPYCCCYFYFSLLSHIAIFSFGHDRNNLETFSYVIK